MEQTANEKVRALTDRLNRFRHEYFNLSAPSVSDEVYDRMLNELAALEKETGFQMANSPTQTVGYPAVSDLEKTTHKIPLLSMQKTHSTEDLQSFMGDQLVMLMPKLDGLTMKLTYEGGFLMEAATRGDGEEGEVVSHNVHGIVGIPDRIPYRERLVVTGEAYIRPSDFEDMKATMLDSSGKPYKNARNMAAGSVRLLDCAACKERRVAFTAFNVLEGFEQYEYKVQRLNTIKQLGFPVCKYLASRKVLTREDIEAGIEFLRLYATDNDIPIDGIVMRFNNAAYAESCGRTGDHYKDSIAFKFEDDLYETRLREIEWMPGRTGEIAPVAIFDTVEIDGCDVSRASLHNLSFIEGLELMPGNRILVCKRGQIIPHVEENLDRGGFELERVYPYACPCCGQSTRIHETRETENGKEKITKKLCCDNESCDTRRLRQFVHFAEEKAMDIEGLSEARLEKFLGRGWLHSYADIYRLDQHRNEIVQMEGFGEKSWQNLWDAIQHSRMTTFVRFMVSMDIPLVGNTASRTLNEYFKSDTNLFLQAVIQDFDFSQLPNIGEVLHQNIRQWFRKEENWLLWHEVRRMVRIMAYEEPTAAQKTDNPFAGLTLVVTGKVEPYTRDGIHAKIESLGAHVAGCISSKTDYLICGENAGSKLEKAQRLGVKILTPAEFFRMIGESA